MSDEQQPSEPTPTTPTADAPASPDAAASETAPEAPRTIKAPTAWGDVTKKAQPKRWSAEGRGDDPTVRIIHEPLAQGIGTGKSFSFLFGFKRAARVDQGMLERELAEINDDIEVLRNAGYTVVVDPQATRDDFIAKVEGRGEGVDGLVPAGFYWSAHGHADGGIECCDGGVVYPTDLDPAKVSPGLRLAIFGACYVGARSVTWRNALGGRPLVVGWGRPVTIDRAVDFLQAKPETNTDLDDLIRRWLLSDEALPNFADEHGGLPERASTRGRIGELAERVKPIAEMLGARWREEGNIIKLEVPLANRRSQFVELFLVDASEPYCEGEVLVGVESRIGETSTLVDVQLALAGSGHAGYGRIALVRSETDMPCLVGQSFTPFARATDQDIAAHLYQVALKADAIEAKLFGGDAG